MGLAGDVIEDMIRRQSRPRPTGDTPRARALAAYENANDQLWWVHVAAAILLNAVTPDEELGGVADGPEGPFDGPNFLRREMARRALVDPGFASVRRMVSHAAGWPSDELSTIGARLATAGWPKLDPKWQADIAKMVARRVAKPSRQTH